MENPPQPALVALLEVSIPNTQAQALYRSAGHQPCAPFPPCQAAPVSLFKQRRL